MKKLAHFFALALLASIQLAHAQEIKDDGHDLCTVMADVTHMYATLRDQDGSTLAMARDSVEREGGEGAVRILLLAAAELAFTTLYRTPSEHAEDAYQVCMNY